MPYANKEEYRKYQREYRRKQRGTEINNYRPRKEIFQGYFVICEQCEEVRKLHMKTILKIKTPLCKKCYCENMEPWNKGMRTAKPETEKDYKEPRWSSEYRDWHNECLRRDWYHCQLCESKERLEVHHIKSYKDYPQERLNLNNGITLCKKCHLEVHNFSVLDQQ